MIFTPEPPQKLMIEFLLNHPRAYAMVGMGIGKSASCLEAFSRLYRAGKAKAMLVLAPMRVANLTWPMETQDWDQFRWMRVANLRSELGKRAFIAGAAHIYVLNYESIPALVKLVEKRGGTLPYDIIVYDEITKAKNHKSKRITALRKQIPTVYRRWGLSGTPTPNSLLDLFAPVRLLDDGQRLGVSFENFKKTWFTATDYMEYNWAPREGSDKAIEQKISDISLVLRSSDWLKDVPDASINDVEISLGPALTAQYKEFEEELILKLREDAEITAANAAALVSKLLQFTSGAIYDADKRVHEVHDLKMKALAKIVKQAGQPVLVSCQFLHEQARIRRLFPQARFFSDATTPTLQMHLIKQWNDKNIPMLVAHPRSIGHGLNLQRGSSCMVWMSLTYSREDYEQMIARLVRRGQHDVVEVHRLMCPGTVDDVVAEVLFEKKSTEQKLLSALMMLESMRDKPLSRRLRIKADPDTDWM